MDNDGIWLKVLVLIGWIAVAFVFLMKSDINGEQIVQAEQIKTVEHLPARPIPTVESIPKMTTSYVWQPEDPVICDDDEIFPTREEVYYIAKTVHGEASICDLNVKTGVAWVILNRVDSESYPNTIKEVVTQNGQFHGFYRESEEAFTTEEWILCYQIIKAWRSCDDRFRTIPSNYLYFRGDGKSNYFTTYYTQSLSEAKRNAWTWTMPNEFEKGEEQ